MSSRFETWPRGGDDNGLVGKVDGSVCGANDTSGVSTPWSLLKLRSD